MTLNERNGHLGSALEPILFIGLILTDGSLGYIGDVLFFLTTTVGVDTEVVLRSRSSLLLAISDVD